MPDSAGVVIVGGGPVGSALALALRDHGKRALLLEAQTARSADRRPLALSYGSRLILERLGVWPELGMFATPIRDIHVSQRGGFGRARLEASETGLPELGYVVDYGRLAQLLAQAASACVTCHHGAHVLAWQGGDPARVRYEYEGEQQELAASLVVVADGGAVSGAASGDYRQCAVTARVVSERPHNNTAYERFTRHGPLALLPDGDGWALVWTTTPGRAQDLCIADDDRFLAELQREFGNRAGRFVETSARASHALHRRRASSDAAHVVFIGNAAQTLHPVAGQGFNLGLRDAWELAGHILDTADDAPGSPAWLQAYRRRRSVDRGGGIGFTHGLVSLFSNDLLPLGLIRGTGLALFGCMPPLKNFLARRMTFGARG
ncbi:MAG: FAD-dependent monooxygenase [Burkholderiales bacterium]|nr:FAD-dependent monooxygenase [Burkholderiales bacterium]